jgi:hypothetical protein
MSDHLKAAARNLNAAAWVMGVGSALILGMVIFACIVVAMA